MPVDQLRAEPAALERLTGENTLPFQIFFDSLLRDEARRMGVPPAQVETNYRFLSGDGGVDAAIHIAGPADPTGWFGVPTCWQLKARQPEKTAKADLEAEFRKKNDELVALLKAGYGYRLVIPAGLSATMRANRLKTLREEIAKIAPDAPEPMVLSADDLAGWATEFPGIVRGHLASNIPSTVMSTREWGQPLLATTPTYVPTEGRGGVLNRLAEHLDFDRETLSVMLSIRGAAGVGKTRLVYEAVANSDSPAGYALYVKGDDSAALTVAMSIIREQGRAVLVVDECTPDLRRRLRDDLQPLRERVRLITIDNFQQRDSVQDEVWLDRYEETDANAIIDANFDELPEGDRRRNVGLARGYVRFAAHLCTHGVAHGVTDAYEYVVQYIDTPERDALELVSLVSPLGFREDKREELDALAAAFGLDSDIIAPALTRLAQGPGFVETAGRFCYPTPELIARVGLRLAWERWFKTDPTHGLERLPPEFLVRFRARVAASGDEEVRRFVGEHFREWSIGLKVEDLGDLDAMKQLVTLVEVDPELYLVQLSNLLVGAPLGTLADVFEERESEWAQQTDSASARRLAVNVLDNAAAFPEHFPRAEEALFRLALEETEPKIGNNSTALWSELFRVALSGTAVPFPDRLPILVRHLVESDEHTIELVAKAVDEMLETHPTKMVGWTMFGDREKPENWNPASYPEWGRHLADAICAITEALRDTSTWKTDAIHLVVGRHIRGLFSKGVLQPVVALFSLREVSEAARLLALEEIDTFLKYDAGENEKRTHEVTEWRLQLVGKTYRDRVLDAVGRTPWFADDDDEGATFVAELDRLAEEAHEDSSKLAEVLPWLLTDAARSSFPFGAALARADTTGSTWETIASASAAAESIEVLRGYAAAATREHRPAESSVRSWVDHKSDSDPARAFEVLSVFADASERANWLLGQVTNERLSVRYLKSLTMGGAIRDIEPNLAASVFSTLAASPDDQAVAVGTDLYSMLVHGRSADERSRLIRAVPYGESLWELAQRAAMTSTPIRAWGWSQLARDLVELDPIRGITLVVEALAGRTSFSLTQDAGKILIALGADFPTEIMKVLGSALTDGQHRTLFLSEEMTEIFRVLDLETITSWLDSAGREGLLQVARHLPGPTAGDDGSVTLPPITEYVLDRYGDDEDVLSEFNAGQHSGSWWGDLSEVFAARADAVAKLQHHRSPRVRRWAVQEEANVRAQADRWKRRDEERFLEDRP